VDIPHRSLKKSALDGEVFFQAVDFEQRLAHGQSSYSKGVQKQASGRQPRRAVFWKAQSACGG
jgi:hypothetical protein